MKPKSRRQFLKNSFTVGTASFISIESLESMISGKSLFHGLFESQEKDKLISAPENPSEWPAWREELTQWRKAKKQELNYDGSSYRSEAFKWVASNYSCCFIMMCDEEFFDSGSNQYTVEDFVEKGKQRYGGYDSVVLWHAYPRIGFDERNQFDFYRDMPHGIEGLRGVVHQFHQHGIKVFINYNPWDVGTRREPKSDLDSLTDIIRSINADGIFLDTMAEAAGFRTTLDEIKPGIVMESEGALAVEHIETHHSSWAQGFQDGFIPGVLRNKWFEPYHMQHAIHRNRNDNSQELQMDWMNGSGMLVWENVFGNWVGWNERDKATYRIMSSVQRQFHDLFSGENWTPLSQESEISGVFISLWEKDGIQLWTLINRNKVPVNGTIMKIKYDRNKNYYNLAEGRKINEEVLNGMVSFSGDIKAHGVTCLFSIRKNKITTTFRNFLSAQKKIFETDSTDETIPVKHNIVVNPVKHILYSTVPEGMVEVPAVSTNLIIEYKMREVGSYENFPDYMAVRATNRQHSFVTSTRKAELGRYAIDETPVTNTMFKEFLDRSGYEPGLSENFLKHWINGKVPEGKEDHPVVYVDLSDAMAYARWAKKRLPTEEEWQYAAAGPNHFVYPWGNQMEDNKCNLNTNGITTPVRAFPEGVSPFGCYDMCGNTWEWTNNVYSDGRTRFIMLKGGSCFRAEGSHWYPEGGPQKNGFITKFLLMWPGLNRSSTIGFRCVVDLG